MNVAPVPFEEFGAPATTIVFPPKATDEPRYSPDDTHLKVGFSMFLQPVVGRTNRSIAPVRIAPVRLLGAPAATAFPPIATDEPMPPAVNFAASLTVLQPVGGKRDADRNR